MKILLLISFVIFGILFIFKNVFLSAKRNLFKDQEVWTNKEIKIKYKKSQEISESNRNDNYLELIAEESKVFLEDEST